MKITVNDLAFEFPLYEQTKTMAAVKKFISICHKLESTYCHNVERLVGADIHMEKEIYPSGNLYRIVREIEDRDDRRYFLGLLVNREKISQLPEKPFVYKNRESFACAMARGEALVSLETEEGFQQAEITGMIGDEKVRIKTFPMRSIFSIIGSFWE